MDQDFLDRQYIHHLALGVLNVTLMNTITYYSVEENEEKRLSGEQKNG